MNEHIESLAVKARLSWCIQTDFDQKNIEEFAKLILKECVDILETGMEYTASEKSPDYNAGELAAYRWSRAAIIEKFDLK